MGGSLSNIGALVERLIAGGFSVSEASTIIAEAVAAGAATSAYRKSPGAERQQRYRNRNKASQSVTNRNDVEASRTVTNRNESVTSDENANQPISKPIKNRKRQNSEPALRGTRILPDWKLTDAEKLFARAEGFSDFEIEREASKFRDYWTAAAGSNAVKRDWTATWRQWIRNGAERAGKTPRRQSGDAVPSGVLVKTGTEAWDAWQAHMKATTGKGSPMSPRDDGWRFPTEYPPGYERRKTIDAPVVPRVQSMQ